MEAPRAEAHRAEAKNAEDGVPFPPCDESSEYENDPRHKSRREDGSISVHASDDDIEQLLAKASVSATASHKPNFAGEDELAKGLIAFLLDEETKVEQLLVDIAIVVEEACKRRSHGINFLASLYGDGLGYSPINTARSALSFLLAFPGNAMFGNHPLVSQFLKGFFFN